MGRQRREFTPEYKDEAVRLVINTGRAVATVGPGTRHRRAIVGQVGERLPGQSRVTRVGLHPITRGTLQLTRRRHQSINLPGEQEPGQPNPGGPAS